MHVFVMCINVKNCSIFDVLKTWNRKKYMRYSKMLKKLTKKYNYLKIF